MARAESKPEKLSTRARWAAVGVLGTCGIIGVLGGIQAKRSPSDALATNASVAKTSQTLTKESRSDSGKSPEATNSGLDAGLGSGVGVVGGMGVDAAAQDGNKEKHTQDQDALALQTGGRLKKPEDPQDSKGFEGSIRMRININTATTAQLEMLPRIGPALAARIIEDRTRKGPYRTLDDLDRVPGIGPKTILRLVPYASVK